MKFESWALGWFVVGAGVLLVLGLLTPVASGGSALAETIVHSLHPVWAASFLDLLTIDMVVIAVALVLLGPGAISLDAHFFGRRKIVIPRITRS